MAQTQLEFVQCFRYDPRSGHTFCRIKTDGISCRAKISNNHHGNKMRHLSKKHPNIFEQVKKNTKKKKVPNTVRTIRVAINVQTIYTAFVELVSKNGRPFCIAEDSGMRIIIDPILEGIFKGTGERYKINRVVIEQKVREAYLVVVEKIKQETRNKPVTIMIDIATKHGIAMLGINVRFFNNGKYITRTIGMEQLTKNHTTVNIHSLLLETLNTFELKAIQIYAFNSDNAFNVVNVSELLNEDCTSYMIADGFSIDDQMFSLLNDQSYATMLNELQVLLTDDHRHVTFISCAAHTTQLAVDDAIEHSIFSEPIQMVKDIVKKLRTPNISNILRERKLNQAIMDHDIRWSYKFKMVKKYFLYIHIIITRYELKNILIS